MTTAAAELPATPLLGELLDALEDHVALLASDGNVVAVNQAWTRFAVENGYMNGGTGLGVNYPGVCERGSDEDGEAAAAARGIREVLAGERDRFTLNYPCHSPADQRWYQMKVRPVHLDGLVGAIVIHTDRTAEHLAALRVIEERDSAAAAEQALRFRAELLDAVEQAVIATDLDGTITYWNRFAEKLYGWSAAEACGRNIIDVTPADVSREQAQSLMAALRRGESWSGEFEVASRDGRSFHAHVTDSPIRASDGTMEGVVGVSIDVSDRLQLEERLRQSQRLEAIGQLAGGVAHDFNNLLTVIGAHCDYLLDALPADQQAAADVRAIRDAGQGAAVLTRQLLAFSRKQFLSLAVTDLNGIVTETRRMLGRLLGDDIEVELQLAEDLGRVLVDAGQIEQVIMNLAVNARDAMPGGGRVVIATAAVSLTIPVARYDGVPPGNYAVLTVSDTGIGMDAATQAHIFEPFFTTKEFAKGTGLGLSTVYGIVKQCDGYVFVRSALGEGTSLDILFPVASADPQTRVPTPEATAPNRNTETVLLVEDDSAVRKIARRLLVQEGYVVIEAQNGAEALKLSDDHGGAIHLVLSDAVMPGMSGIAVLGHVRSTRPSCRAILMSGYTDDEMTRRGIFATDVAFIQKPFRPADLGQLVRQTLDAPMTTEEERP